jgi:hypothetical protein
MKPVNAKIVLARVDIRAVVEAGMIGIIEEVEDTTGEVTAAINIEEFLGPQRECSIADGRGPDIATIRSFF